MCGLQSLKLPRVFALAPDTVATALGAMKLNHPNRAVIELEDQRQVVGSKNSPETPVSLLMNRDRTSFAGSPFRFLYSVCIYISFFA